MYYFDYESLQVKTNRLRHKQRLDLFYQTNRYHPLSHRFKGRRRDRITDTCKLSSKPLRNVFLLLLPVPSESLADYSLLLFQEPTKICIGLHAIRRHNPRTIFYITTLMSWKEKIDLICQ